VIIFTDTAAVMEHLHAIRDLRGLTQRALAAQIGVEQSRICGYERGTHVPSSGSLLRVAHALGYDLALVPREDAP
jgi:transcriptional regulator with XRE-family HTH domain